MLANLTPCSRMLLARLIFLRSRSNSYLRSPKFITVCATHTGSIVSRFYSTALWYTYFKRILILPQYGETNVVHFLFSLLRIKGSTCFEHYLLILMRSYKVALGILRACYVIWLQQDWGGTGVFTVLMYYDARSTKHYLILPSHLRVSHRSDLRRVLRSRKYHV
jgi:hypothetical protein